METSKKLCGPLPLFAPHCTPSVTTTLTAFFPSLKTCMNLISNLKNKVIKKYCRRSPLLPRHLTADLQMVIHIPIYFQLWSCCSARDCANWLFNAPSSHTEITRKPTSTSTIILIAFLSTTKTTDDRRCTHFLRIWMWPSYSNSVHHQENKCWPSQTTVQKYNYTSGKFSPARWFQSTRELCSCTWMAPVHIQQPWRWTCFRLLRNDVRIRLWDLKRVCTLWNLSDTVDDI